LGWFLTKNRKNRTMYRVALNHHVNASVSLLSSFASRLQSHRTFSSSFSCFSLLTLSRRRLQIIAACNPEPCAVSIRSTPLRIAVVSLPSSPIAPRVFGSFSHGP
jgi:hypothetical protein